MDPDESKTDTRLTKEQQLVLDQALRRESIFVTGGAGTGKSFLLRTLVQRLNAKKLVVNVTASTGIAACHVGGVTVHSFAGIGNGEGELHDIIKRSKYRTWQWQRCDVLIIDEISMLSATVFDNLNRVAQAARKTHDEPFGGIQVLVFGDFYQLPPVSGDFAFRAACWEALFPPDQVVRLTQIIRQHSDPKFGKLLQRMRVGTMTPDDIRVLATPTGARIKDATRLYSLNRKVDSHNAKRLRALLGRETVFAAVDRGKTSYLKNLRIPSRLRLKVGTRIILMVNLSVGLGLANGSQGTVLAVRDPEAIPPTTILSDAEPDESGSVCVDIGVWSKAHREGVWNTYVPGRNSSFGQGMGMVRVRFDHGLVFDVPRWQSCIRMEGKKVASRTQVPMALAYAISIHKSQGMTIPRLRVSFARIFAHGQAYVAMSRAPSRASVRIDGFRAEVITVSEDVQKYYAALP